MTSRRSASGTDLREQPTILRQTKNLWEQPEVTRVAMAAGGSTSRPLTQRTPFRCRRDLRRLPQELWPAADPRRAQILREQHTILRQARNLQDQNTILRQTRNLWEQPEVTRVAMAAGGSTSRLLTQRTPPRCRRDLRRLPQELWPAADPRRAQILREQPTILRQTQNLWEQPEVTRVAMAAGGST